VAHEQVTPLELELDLIVEYGATTSPSEDRIAELSRFVLADAGESGKWLIAVVLTTDDRLQQLHREYMGIDSPTDVITFPSDPMEGGSDAGGDIVISVDRAEEQGSEAGLSKDEEIEFLIVHGLLHLCGWDDHDENDRVRMLAYQTELIRRFNENEVGT
jgi:rRNA maturation RNase YbeY